MEQAACSKSWTSPGAGITDACTRDSDVLHMIVVLLTGLAMYNGCELAITIFLTFKRYSGLYFWSLLISSMGVVVYAIGFLLMFMDITTGNLRFLAIALNTVGWWPMITGQSLVLWSRLHLILHGEEGDKILKYTKWMIIINAILLQPATTILSFGSNGPTHTQSFIKGYNIMEKIQMAGFFCQELILSTIYIVQTKRVLRDSLQRNSRKTMLQLILVNVLIIILDVGLLGLEAASLYILETLVKGVVYSIKLKLEFGILSIIVDISGGSRAHRNQGDFDVDFVQMDAKADADGYPTLPALASNGRVSAAEYSDSSNARSTGRTVSQDKATRTMGEMEAAMHVEDTGTTRRVDYASPERHDSYDSL